MNPHPLGALLLAPSRAGLFLDFDGVLSDISAVADQAVPRAAIPELLSELVTLLGRVVIISGRPVAYLDPYIPKAVDIVGQYGLEGRSKGRHHSLHEAEVWRPTMQRLAQDAVGRYGPEVVEPKGLSVTLHYRGDPNLADGLNAWVRQAAATTGVEWRLAKFSFELHPPIKCDKGTALLERVANLDPVAYFGDDLGDLPAFDGLDVLSQRGVGTVRVAVASDEAPSILLRRADHVVSGPAGAEAVLRELADRLCSAPT